MHNYFNKICTIFFIFVAIAITNTACCAKGVPNYNPKDPNPKPGLYYVGEMKFPRQRPKALLLNNGDIFVFGGSPRWIGEEAHRDEVISLRTRKSKLTSMRFPFWRLKDVGIVMNDGRVLLTNYDFNLECNNTILYIYNPITDTYQNTNNSFTNSYYMCGIHLENVDNDIAIYACPNVDRIVGKNPKDVYLHADIIKYIYKTNTNTISSKTEIIKNGYRPWNKSWNRQRANIQKNIYKTKGDNNIDNIIYLNNDENKVFIIFYNKQNMKYELSEYNVLQDKFTDKGIFVPSFATAIQIDKNKILLIGGYSKKILSSVYLYVF